jgi:hypothetical protein
VYSLSPEELLALAVSNKAYFHCDTKACIAKVHSLRNFVQSNPKADTQKALKAINALRARLLLLLDWGRELQQQQQQQADKGTGEQSC